MWRNVRKLSEISFEKTFGILKGKRKSIKEMEVDIYDEWEV